MLFYGEKESGSFFLKVPAANQSSGIVEKEKEGAEKAASISPESFRVASVRTHSNGILEIEDIGRQGKRSNEFSDKHKRVLAEIYQKTAKSEVSGKATCLKEGARCLALAQLKSDPRIPENLIAKLKGLEKNLHSTPFRSALAHGDFTPWNMFVQQDHLAVYDWEMAKEAYPLGFDAFHFVIQKGIMIERKSWTDIRTVSIWMYTHGRKTGTTRCIGL